MAYPVASRTASAPAFKTGRPASAASRARSSRFEPDTSAKIGRPAAMKTSDLTIWLTVVPTAAAASTAVRVEAGNSSTGRSSSPAAFSAD